jgi:heme/copper-type cytochrome/quinol oxidase subunit 4
MKKLVYGFLSFAPVLAFAQTLNSPDAIVAFIARTVRTLIPVFFGLAIIYFFWGLIVFLRAAGDPKAQEAGRNQMIWGVIAIAVMLSVYGLTVWLRTLFGIGGDTSLPIPTVPGL